MRKTILLMASCVCAAVILVATIGGVADAATSTPGVTASSIAIGVPYVDLAAVGSLGVKLDQGSFPDAYKALIASLNAHGGIDGRKLVPYIVAVNPVGTAPAAAACTRLTEDDPVFVAIATLSPDCYLQQHDTPTIASSFQGNLPPGSAPNFTLQAPPSAYDPVQLAAFEKAGVFKGKKVGLYAGETTDESELAVVRSALSKLHVKVVQSAVDDAPPNDQLAATQDAEAIAERFQAAGVNEVVAVGSGSASWPQYLASSQSTYDPAWVATNDNALSGVLSSASTAEDSILAKVVTSTPGASQTGVWEDPGIQKCVAIIRKAYPSDTITAYNADAPSNDDHTYIAPESACENLALFTTIAKAAGKDLTVKTFTRAGESLKNITLPGSGGAVSFGPGQPYALGTVYLGHFHPTTKQLVFSKRSASA
jgi:Periplasmic binding protein